MKKRVIIIVIISTIVVLSSTVMYLFWVRYQNHLDYQQKTLTFIQQVELGKPENTEENIKNTSRFLDITSYVASNFFPNKDEGDRFYNELINGMNIKRKVTTDFDFKNYEPKSVEPIPSYINEDGIQLGTIEEYFFNQLNFHGQLAFLKAVPDKFLETHFFIITPKKRSDKIKEIEKNIQEEEKAAGK
ncbi:MAG: hypothetical protein PHQ33_03250 [Bacteroidales bacterium]|jgi:hypothetical protein|nr:hypothetical protein [Bacteroidales bacterium]MDD4394885.1 hypothetical protein [Bacteroidales bacterium]